MNGMGVVETFVRGGRRIECRNCTSEADDDDQDENEEEKENEDEEEQTMTDCDIHIISDDDETASPEAGRRSTKIQKEAQMAIGRRSAWSTGDSGAVDRASRVSAPKAGPSGLRNGGASTKRSTTFAKHITPDQAKRMSQQVVRVTENASRKEHRDQKRLPATSTLPGLRQPATSTLPGFRQPATSTLPGPSAQGAFNTDTADTSAFVHLMKQQFFSQDSFANYRDMYQATLSKAASDQVTREPTSLLDEGSLSQTLPPLADDIRQSSQPLKRSSLRFRNTTPGVVSRRVHSQPVAVSEATGSVGEGERSVGVTFSEAAASGSAVARDVRICAKSSLHSNANGTLVVAEETHKQASSEADVNMENEEETIIPDEDDLSRDSIELSAETWDRVRESQGFFADDELSCPPRAQSTSKRAKTYVPRSAVLGRQKNRLSAIAEEPNDWSSSHTDAHDDVDAGGVTEKDKLSGSGDTRGSAETAAKDPEAHDDFNFEGEDAVAVANVTYRRKSKRIKSLAKRAARLSAGEEDIQQPVVRIPETRSKGGNSITPTDGEVSTAIGGFQPPEQSETFRNNPEQMVVDSTPRFGNSDFEDAQQRNGLSSSGAGSGGNDVVGDSERGENAEERSDAVVGEPMRDDVETPRGEVVEKNAATDAGNRKGGVAEGPRDVEAAREAQYQEILTNVISELRGVEKLKMIAILEHLLKTAREKHVGIVDIMREQMPHAEGD